MIKNIVLAILLFLPLAGAANQHNGIGLNEATTQDSATSVQLPPLPATPTRTAFIVISKLNQTLTVYDRNTTGDTVMVAQFPCCMGKNKGNKQRRGDMRTPESPAGKPFKITMIQNASNWKHDFHDGRGNIRAYGHWFLRLATPGFKSIGIHGSTNNENSVPGRASEGCIRLLDKDIITLKEHFAYVGMPVIVQAEDQGLSEWEARARKTTAK